MNNEPIIVENIFNAPAGKVWKAITDAHEMKKWYFDLPGFEAEQGYEFQFEGGTEQKKYLHLCKVTEVQPGKKLTYSWRYDGYEGISFVTFEIFPGGEKTKIKLTHSGVESFPSDNPDFAKTNFIAGWNEIIGSSLKKYLEN